MLGYAYAEEQVLRQFDDLTEAVIFQIPIHLRSRSLLKFLVLENERTLCTRRYAIQHILDNVHVAVLFSYGGFIRHLRNWFGFHPFTGLFGAGVHLLKGEFLPSL